LNGRRVPLNEEGGPFERGNRSLHSTEYSLPQMEIASSVKSGTIMEFLTGKMDPIIYRPNTHRYEDVGLHIIITWKAFGVRCKF